MQGPARSLLALVVLLGGPGAARADEAWLDLTRPAPGQVAAGKVALIEVSGRAGRGILRHHDVVVAIDLSESALYASGLDINDNGVTGVTRAVRPQQRLALPYRRWTTDFEDTIVAAELAMARRLIQRLAEDGARVGLVTFAGRARLRARVGDAPAALAALDRVRVRLDRSGTNLSAATLKAVRALSRAPETEEPRRRVLMLLSDGIPTTPAPEIHARLFARKAAETAARAGVEIYGMALGTDPRPREVFARMAAITGGRYLVAVHPGVQLEIEPVIELASLERIRIHNRTTDAPGRAVRLFPDGSFDGFVPLAPGRNRLLVAARTTDGEEVELERTVFFKLGPESDGDRDLYQSLRDRTVETELAGLARRLGTAVKNLRFSVER